MRGLLAIEPLYHQIVAGHKTQTRRSGGLELVNGRKATKKQPAIIANPNHWIIINHTTGSVEFIKKLRYQKQPDLTRPIHPDDTVICKPRYKVGEVLFLKEPYLKKFGETHYKFDLVFSSELRDKLPWQNKLFMPADAARVYVRITGIKCERLLDISDEDCIAEGVNMPLAGGGTGLFHHPDKFTTSTPKGSFIDLYKFANKMKASAEIPNLWVWAYAFEYLPNYQLTQ